MKTKEDFNILVESALRGVREMETVAWSNYESGDSLYLSILNCLGDVRTQLTSLKEIMKLIKE